MLAGFCDLKSQALQLLPHSTGQILIPFEYCLDPLFPFLCEMVTGVGIEYVLQHVCFSCPFFCGGQSFLQSGQDHIPYLTLVKIFFISKKEIRDGFRTGILGPQSLVLVLQRFIGLCQFSHLILQVCLRGHTSRLYLQ